MFFFAYVPMKSISRLSLPKNISSMRLSERGKDECVLSEKARGGRAYSAGVGLQVLLPSLVTLVATSHFYGLGSKSTNIQKVVFFLGYVGGGVEWWDKMWAKNPAALCLHVQRKKSARPI